MEEGHNQYPRSFGIVPLVEAIAANLPGASWQRCRTHYAANLMTITPKASWPWVKALLQSAEPGQAHGRGLGLTPDPDRGRDGRPGTPPPPVRLVSADCR